MMGILCCSQRRRSQTKEVKLNLTGKVPPTTLIPKPSQIPFSFDIFESDSNDDDDNDNNNHNNHYDFNDDHPTLKLQSLIPQSPLPQLKLQSNNVNKDNNNQIIKERSAMATKPNKSVLELKSTISRSKTNHEIVKLFGDSDQTNMEMNNIDGNDENNNKRTNLDHSSSSLKISPIRIRFEKERSKNTALQSTVQKNLIKHILFQKISADGQRNQLLLNKFNLELIRQLKLEKELLLNQVTTTKSGVPLRRRSRLSQIRQTPSAVSGNQKDTPDADTAAKPVKSKFDPELIREQKIEFQRTKSTISPKNQINQRKSSIGTIKSLKIQETVETAAAAARPVKSRIRTNRSRLNNKSLKSSIVVITTTGKQIKPNEKSIDNHQVK